MKTSFKAMAQNQDLLFVKNLDNNGSFTDYGPFKSNEIFELIKNQTISEKSLIFIQSLNEWLAIGQFEDAKEYFKNELALGIEKRIMGRRNLNAPVRLSFFDHEIIGVAKDISSLALSLNTFKKVEKTNETFFVKIEHPFLDKHIFHAKILRLSGNDENQNIIVTFLNLTSEQKDLILSFVYALKGSSDF